MYAPRDSVVASVQCRWILPHETISVNFVDGRKKRKKRRKKAGRFAATGVRETVSPFFSFIDLPEGPYLSATLALDEQTLCNLDCTSRGSRERNESRDGPWRALGKSKFRGVELEYYGKFDVDLMQPLPARFARQVNWRRRYLLFDQRSSFFRAPYDGRTVARVNASDQIAKCQCMVASRPDRDARVYIEFHVRSNPDYCGFALADCFNKSGLTFSPDTGAVIFKQTVHEMPRMCNAAYVQPLACSQSSTPFEGFVGVYVNGGHVAFFRKDALNWETTGYVSDLSWARSPCVTPCTLFRGPGSYNVRVIRMGTVPPMDPGMVPASYDQNSWTNIDLGIRRGSIRPERRRRLMFGKRNALLYHSFPVWLE